MAKPLSSIGKDMKMVASAFSIIANKLVVKIAAQAGKNAANVNPIDTGYSSGNWQASVGNPEASEIQSFMPSSSVQRMNQFESTEKQPGQSVFLINPVPYVRDLNAGSSRQAPPMWIERASEKAIIETIKKYKTVKLSGEN